MALADAALLVRPAATVAPAPRRRKPLRRPLVVWCAVVGIFVVGGVAAPIISPYAYDLQNLGNQLRPPLWAGGTLDHVLGTDEFGRDILSRLLYGARASLLVGLLSVVLAGLIGISLGLISGYRGGALDGFVMRVADIQYSFPYILLAIIIAAFWGAGLITLIVSLGLAGWATFARTARGSALSVRERDYVSAARALGASQAHIITRHILPNIMAPLLVFTTFQVPSRILAEATLSFVGLGVQPPEPSWGNMLSQNRGYLISQPWLVILPGLAIMLVAIAVNQLGDALRETLDPRMRGRTE
ncbi:MAG: ABC transporter permease [Chloroflexota bacterium]